MYDLSILIPARNEEFISNTVADIIKNKRGKTQIIVGLDGAWPLGPGIAEHPDVVVVYVSESLGQRGMTNYLCKLSTAKYVAKTDAHCAFDEGFDVKLMDAMQDNYTIVPVMRNMHVFNWRCLDCGDETYQGPVPEGCKNCNVNTPDRFEKNVVWRAKPSPNSSAFKFTPDRLQFKYFSNLKRSQDKSGERLVETMSLQGSFFMLTREKYWELNISDESWGGWGQQGTEVALKTWLSGGRVVCLLDTWYAHMFRTQDGFAFPWNDKGTSQGRQQHQARKASADLFFNNKWDKQVRPLSWVVERFWDDLQKEPDREDDKKWTQAELDRIKQADGKFQKGSKGIIYYTDNQLNTRLAHKVQDQIRGIGLPITSSSLKPMDKMGKNIRLRAERGYLTMFKQILAALEASTQEIVFFCEHDVLYHPSHFEFTPTDPNKFYYNQNFWKVWPDGFVAHWDANQVSGLVCYREHAIAYYKERVAELEGGAEFNRSYEPGGRDPSQYEVFNSEYPNIDVRHEGNLTKSHRSPEDFRDKSTCVNWQETTIDKIPGWSDLRVLLGL